MSELERLQVLAVVRGGLIVVAYWLIALWRRRRARHAGVVS